MGTKLSDELYLHPRKVACGPGYFVPCRTERHSYRVYCIIVDLMSRSTVSEEGAGEAAVRPSCLRFTILIIRNTSRRSAEIRFKSSAGRMTRNERITNAQFAFPNMRTTGARESLPFRVPHIQFPQFALGRPQLCISNSITYRFGRAWCGDGTLQIAASPGQQVRSE